ncbi:MAG: STAS/SEC14 domain-containing protein [Candidatus Omnitrophota bacterium]
MKSGWIEYKEKRIWFAQYNDLGRDVQAFEREVLLVTQIMIKEPEQSILLLIDYRGTGGSMKFFEVLKDSALKVKKFTKKSAVVGVEGIKRVLLKSIIRFSALDVKIFDDLEAAKEWLVQD